MKNKNILLFIVISFYSLLQLKAQGIDAEKVYTGDNLKTIVISADNAGNVVGLLYSGIQNDKEIHFVEGLFRQDSCPVYRTLIDDGGTWWLYAPSRPPVLKVKGGRIYLFFHGFTRRFFIIDENMNLLRSDDLGFHILDFAVDSSGSVVNFVLRSDLPASVGAIKYDFATDCVLLRKHFVFSFLESEDYSINISRFVVDENEGDSYIVGILGNGFTSRSFVIKLDASFNAEVFKVYNGLELKDAVFANGHLIVTGTTTNSTSSNCFVAALTSEELEMIWGKQINGEMLDVQDCYINTNGEKVFSLSVANGKNSFSAVTLNMQGAFEWASAYGNYCNVHLVNNKGEFIGAWFQVDTNGSITENTYIKLKSGYGGTECGVVPTCVAIEDYTLLADTSTHLAVFPLYVPPFDHYNQYQVDSGSFDCNAYCPSDVLGLPSTAFTFPSVLCIGDTLHALGNNNALAHGVEWHLTGPGVDSVLTDSLGFRYVPAEPGTYTLEQTIWYLGCAYSEAHEVEVLPALELHIVPEGPACSPPLRLGLEANRPLQQVQWAHGPTETNITVQNQGWYTVTASDGICTATDSLQVVFVDSLLAGEAPLVLPPDTMVCVQDLPFSLDVLAPLADSLLLDGIRTAPTLPLPEAGTYLISACIQGCCYSESFNLEVYDCAPRIYMPTAISPNGDGINDELYPQGKNFTTLSLKVFHRWGGLLHSTEGPDARWDAHDAPPGTYVWLLEYRSHYDGSTQRMSGEVEVVR